MTVIFSRVIIVTMISQMVSSLISWILLQIFLLLGLLRPRISRFVKFSSYLLELRIVISLSHGVPQRDLSIAKQTNLFGFDTGGFKVWILWIGATYLKISVSSHSKSVAASTELLGHGSDETDLFVNDDPHCQLIKKYVSSQPGQRTLVLSTP